jgi:hypothetical protein
MAAKFFMSANYGSDTYNCCAHTFSTCSHTEGCGVRMQRWALNAAWHQRSAARMDKHATDTGREVGKMVFLFRHLPGCGATVFMFQHRNSGEACVVYDHSSAIAKDEPGSGVLSRQQSENRSAKRLKSNLQRSLLRPKPPMNALHSPLLCIEDVDVNLMPAGTAATLVRRRIFVAEVQCRAGYFFRLVVVRSSCLTCSAMS